MPGDPVTGETTLAILLGGSRWPKSPQLAASAAFASSAQDFKQYLTDERGFHLPPVNILDLFDSPKTSPEIVEEIQSYLRHRIQTTPVPRDLFIYYTGHGGFINGKDYFLAVRSTIEGLEGTSSIRVSDLASTLRGSARDLRRFLILDCCFAAAAFKEFQSTPGAAARLQTLEAFPRRGTTLLCSSSSRNVSIAPTGERNTMFSGALLEVLRHGDGAIDSPLSLEDVGLKVGDLIRDRYEDRAVRPEVHSPDQREEDIARMPLFPNPAARTGGVASIPRVASVPRVATPQPDPVHRPGPQQSPSVSGQTAPAPPIAVAFDWVRRSRLSLAAALVPVVVAVAIVMLNGPTQQPADKKTVIKTVETPPIVQAGRGLVPPTSTGPTGGRDTPPREIGERPVVEATRKVSPVKLPSAPKPVPPADETRDAPPVATPPAPKPGGAVSMSVSGVPFRLISLPAGEFRMGCSSGDNECEDDEKPIRRVSVDAFHMSATEVTQEIWQAVMEKNPSDFKGPGLPVEHVSWNDAQDFLEKLNQRRDGFSYRLPTEAEWEYAARAGDSPQPSLAGVAWFGLAESSGRSSRPQSVATKAPNAWGLYDMLGNVAEWCEDWYSPSYQRVVRGGSWVDGARSLRVSARGKAMPGTRDYSIGVRIVREPR